MVAYTGAFTSCLGRVEKALKKVKLLTKVDLPCEGQHPVCEKWDVDTCVDELKFLNLVFAELCELAEVAHSSALRAGALPLLEDDTDVSHLQNNMHAIKICTHMANTWVRSQCNPAGDVLKEERDSSPKELQDIDNMYWQEL